MTITKSAGMPRGKRSLLAGLMLLLLTCFLHTHVHAQCSQLVWSDEFNGTSLDLNNWSYQIGNGTNDGLVSGWGNNELQYYTSRTNNISVSGGNLIITARAESYLGANYTSARIRSTNTNTFVPANQWFYGAIEARIQMPASPTNGASKIWPAFWMLPDNGPWPNTGEIDIAEIGVAGNPGHYNGTLHYFQGGHAQAGTGATNLGNLSTGFHVYRVDWGPNSIRFSVDGVQVGATLTNGSTGSAGVIGAGNWPFDNATNPYHVILNLAVGGNFTGGGTPNNTYYPMQMLVDYVRVYSTPSAVTITGKSKVMQGQSGVVYTVANVGTNTYNWSVPAGATITAGQGTNQITVSYGAAAVSGNVSVTITPSGGGCVASTINKPVSVLANVCTLTLEDFETAATRNIGFNFSTGWMNRPTPASASNPYGFYANPNTAGINPSLNVGKYERNGGLAYDVVAYNDIAVGDASIFRTGVASFRMDINTNAPVGTTIMVQLENKDLAQTGWPNGIYTRFTAVTTSAANTWTTLNFTYLDGPDPVMLPSQVDQIVIFFGVGTAGGVGGLTGNTSTYYWDNFKRVGTTPNTSAIAGAATVCQNNTGQIYSVTGLPGSTYNWGVPAGASVASGQGTNTATVNFGTTSGNVSVIETSSIGCVGPTRTRMVTVSGACVLNADFAANPTTTCLGANVVFTDLTSGKTGGETYNWNFGAGASLPAGTTGAGPFTVTYSTSGLKTVTLTVTKGATNDTETKTNYINILPAPSGCLMADDFNNNTVSFVTPIPGAFSHAESGTNWTVTNAGYSEWQNWVYTLNNGASAAPINFACSLNKPIVKIRARSTANSVVRIQMLDGTGLATDNVPGFNIELTPTSTFYTINYQGALRNFYSPTPGYLDTTNITQLQFFVNPGYVSYPVTGVNGTYNTMFTGSVIIDWIGIGDATCGDPLPVDLLFLRAKKTNTHSVQLHWATAMEKDNSHFEIRRSNDGINFVTIATQPGAGNSTQTLDYYFTDEHLLKSGKYYYQLNQVDYDGSQSFSQVVAVDFNPEINIEVIPTIVNSGQNIQINSLSSEALSITLLDLNGKILAQKINTFERQISTEGLSAGVYLVQVVNGESVVTQRVILQ